MNIQDKRSVLAYLSHLKESMNWGKISFPEADLEHGKGKIKVLNSFESLTQKCTQPSCHFFRGFLAGFLSELFGRDILLSEVKCVGRGDDYCEFEFK